MFARRRGVLSVLLLINILWLALTLLAGGEVGWANVWKTQGGAVSSLTKIYSLGLTNTKYC